MSANSKAESHVVFVGKQNDKNVCLRADKFKLNRRYEVRVNLLKNSLISRMFRAEKLREAFVHIFPISSTDFRKKVQFASVTSSV